MKRIWIAGIGLLILFLTLLAVRMDIPAHLFPGKDRPDEFSTSSIPETDTWKNLFLNDRKIGYAHSVLTKQKNGFRLDEMLFMRMNIMGFSQDIHMTTTADLNPDLSLASFDFELESGPFEFHASGKIQPDNILLVNIISSGSPQQAEIKMDHPPHLSSGVLYSAAQEFKLTKKDSFTYHIFDPATMSQEAVIVTVLGDDVITHRGQSINTTKLSINFKGVSQTAWLDENGETIKETGLLGLTLEKTTREDAMAGITGTPAEDITEVASVPVNIKIDNPRGLSVLKIKLSGIDTEALNLNGGRQSIKGDILIITQEKSEDFLTAKTHVNTEAFQSFLSPEPFIESDHPEIKTLSQSIVSPDDAPFRKAQQLVLWVYENIEKRPVISIPDALTTLKNKMGDCNEHAVLLAALARAAGIPSKIESGLVYLRGRFYYHAWNLLYVGKWITADAIFGQMPADATHIRFASGKPDSQLDLIPVIDNVSITILKSEN